MKSFTHNFIYNREPKKEFGKYPIAVINTDNPVAVDWGCGMGYFPLNYGHLFQKVYCFDACYTNFKTVLDKTKDLDNCEVFHFSASKKSGELVKIFKNGDSPYNNSVFENSVSFDYHYAMTINFKDSLKFLNLNHIDFLKVDIEGAEKSFLGGEDLSHVDVIAIEVHWYDKNRTFLSKLLKQFTVIYEGKGSMREFLLLNKKYKKKDLVYI